LKYCYAIFISGILPCWKLASQPLDSILPTRLKEVCVFESRSASFREDKRTVTLDSALLANNRFATLTDILALSGNMFVNASGSSGSNAGVFLRGTQSNQTSVLWNGFPVNSCTLGSFDLSLLPVDLVDQVSVTYGSSATLYGSGTFGGSIDLNNRPNWNDRFHASVSSEIGNYGNLRHSLKIKAGSLKLQYHLGLYDYNATNNFPFYNNFEGIRQIVANNRCTQQGFSQNLFLKLKSNQFIEAGLWYQAKTKEIPSKIWSSTPGNEALRDSSWRSYVKWSKSLGRSVFALRSAYMYAFMRYTNKINPIDTVFSEDTKYNTYYWFNDADYKYTLNNNITLNAGASFYNFTAKSVNYTGHAPENCLVFFGGLKYIDGPFTGNFTASKEFHSVYKIKPLFSIGGRYMCTDRIVLKSNLSNKFRQPTFNDKYWNIGGQKGGNPGLQPETGWSMDASIDYKVVSSEINLVTFTLSGYNSILKNMIQWNASGPENYKEVWARGIEPSAEASYRLLGMNIAFNAAYSFTPSTNIKADSAYKNIIGQQIVYVPRHSANINARIDYKKYFISSYWSYVGKRHSSEGTDADRTYNVIDDYKVLNIYAGIKLAIKNYHSMLTFKVTNLFNKQYQVMPGYAMPGRMYFLSFTLGIEKSAISSDE
jgi:vitamin B12 transporter